MHITQVFVVLETSAELRASHTEEELVVFEYRAAEECPANYIPKLERECKPTPATPPNKPGLDVYIIKGGCIGASLFVSTLLLLWFIKKHPSKAKKLIRSVLRTEFKIILRAWLN